ncbi:MAG: phage tail sheath subtilisin-like domain-containing protein [Desulfobacter sp.]|nr:MAG: phage tail sheath subtilisin-like domain-containing protein [Desulfobacter sp.]
MPSYLHPGVYVEEIPSGSKPIEGVSTSVCAFIGAAVKGPVGEAVLIHSWEDYVKTYGEIASESDHMGLAARSFYQNGGKTAYICRIADTASPTARASDSVPTVGSGGANVFTISAKSVGEWANGIRYRIIKPDPTAQTFALEIGCLENDKFKINEQFKGLGLNPDSPDYALETVNSQSALVDLSLEDAAAGLLRNGSLRGDEMASAATAFSGTLAGTLSLVININGNGAKRISLDTGPLSLAGDNQADGDAVAAALQAAVRDLGPAGAYQNFTCIYDDTAGSERTFLLTSGTAAADSSVVVYDGESPATDLAAALQLNSGADTVSVPGAAPIIPLETLGNLGLGTPLEGGNAVAPKPRDYKNFLATTLKKILDVSIMVLPGTAWDASGSAVASEAVSHCEAMKNRMVILDPPDTPLEQAGQVDVLALPTSTYTALYYPWVDVPNPFYDPEQNPSGKKTLSLAPSALAAGIWCKTDNNRGVWKAPAGVEASLIGASGLRAMVDDGDQDQLNPLGINCLRKIPGFGHVVWGSRTLATKADPEWRYVPVRRTAIFIERSIYEGIQWAVFEPNNHPLWSSLRASIDSFMNGLFRSGAFQGAKASEAYFVRCGLGDTMTQGDIDRGQVIVVVGFAPLKPAEFVIVRIQQKVGQ